MAGDDDLIAPLKAELDLQAGRTVAGAPTEPKSKAVTILGDKAIPYRLLRKVMYTAARADFSDVAFAVTRKASL
jgi:biopolymer transport protein ExbD